MLVDCYPQSGSTWLRFMLAEILTGEPADFISIDVVSPNVGMQSKGPRLLPEGGRLIKSHEPYRRAYRRLKTVYLVRDPRDVLLSQYRHVGKGEDLDHFIPRFLAGEWSPFGGWSSHVSDWLESEPASAGRLLLVRYEDLRTGTSARLREILEYLEVPVAESTVARVIESNELERMREKEHTLTRRRRNVDRGLVEGWRGVLTQEQVDLVDRSFGSTIHRLGYSRA